MEIHVKCFIIKRKKYSFCYTLFPLQDKILTYLSYINYVHMFNMLWAILFHCDKYNLTYDGILKNCPSPFPPSPTAQSVVLHTWEQEVHCFDNGYVGKQPLAWKEYCAEYWLKELQDSMNSGTSHRNLTEMLLKTALNTMQSINLHEVLTLQSWKGLPTKIPKSMKMAESFPIRLKTLWEKEKSLITSNFSFSHSVFKNTWTVDA